MLSIIIPVYNGAEWLAEAIESALLQRIQSYNDDNSLFYSIPEIIVVDDGSTDDSLKIANRYIGLKVVSQVNKGLASARNTGIMNARYDWVLFLDADDKLLPGALNHILSKTEFLIDVIAPSFKEFGLSGAEVILMPTPKLEDFRQGNRIGYCAAIRRSALLEVGGYSPRMVEGYEDLHLWINLLIRGKKIITIPEVLWMYRTKEKSMYRDITPDIHQKLIGQINKDFPEAKLQF